MKVTIGGREQIANISLLIGKSEDAWIEFAADTWNVRLHVVFIESADKKDQGFQVLGKDDHAELTLKNWNSSLPVAIESPHTLGEVNGKTVVFLFTGYTVEGFKRVDFSFFWGANNGK